MVTANVCMCGSDGSFDSMGEGMIVNFDGSVIAHGTTGRADEIITAEVRPDLVREARIHWGVENNIYQLWHRGYVAVKGGAMDCPYTFMQDMVAGTYRLPWERRGQGHRRHVMRLSRRRRGCSPRRPPRRRNKRRPCALAPHLRGEGAVPNRKHRRCGQDRAAPHPPGYAGRPLPAKRGERLSHYFIASVTTVVVAPSGFLVITGSEPPAIKVATVRS